MTHSELEGIRHIRSSVPGFAWTDRGDSESLQPDDIGTEHFQKTSLYTTTAARSVECVVLWTVDWKAQAFLHLPMQEDLVGLYRLLAGKLYIWPCIREALGSNLGRITCPH